MFQPDYKYSDIAGDCLFLRTGPTGTLLITVLDETNTQYNVVSLPYEEACRFSLQLQRWLAELKPVSQ